jgi:hypothetical protein
MAQLIQPILDTFKLLLQSMDASTLGDLQPFAEVKSAGVSFNFPYASVEPGKTVFDPTQDQAAAQGHSIVIQIGVSGTDPEALKTTCVAYAQAVWTAIGAWWPASQWPSPAVAGMNVKEIFVMSIEYSNTYSNGAMFSRYVDLTCIVGVEEY